MLRVRRTSQEPRVEMAPLIDVVFLLLTFFVFSLVLLTRVSVMDLDLPALGSGGQSEAPKAIIVAVDAQGMVYVDGEAVGPASGDGEPLAESTRSALLEAISSSITEAAATAEPDQPPVIRPSSAWKSTNAAFLGPYSGCWMPCGPRDTKWSNWLVRPAIRQRPLHSSQRGR